MPTNGRDLNVNVTNFEDMTGIIVNVDLTDNSGGPLPVSVSNFTDMDLSNTSLNIKDPVSLFDSNFIYDKQTLYWGETTATGGTSTKSSIQPIIEMLVNTTSGSSVYRETKQKFKYQIGKKMVVIMSGIIGNGKANLRQRIGLFDTKNGAFFSCNDGVFSIANRNYITGSPVDTLVVQSSWNQDTMDGNGASGIDIDFSKIQQFIIELEWAGIGYVKYGFIIDGEIYYCHIENYYNLFQDVYMTSPILPIRYEIENTGITSGSTNIQQLSSCVISDGGYNPRGVIRSVDNGVANVTIPSGSYAPFFEIQLRSNRIDGMIKPLRVDISTDGNSDIHWQLMLNPTLATAGVGSYANISTESIGQVRLASTAQITTGTGILLASGYIVGTLNHGSIIIDTDLSINRNISGISDTLVLCTRKVGGGAAETGRASIIFKEFI